MDEKRLIENALIARLDAYAPYSGFYVGAALFTEDGRLFTGCNIENASYGLSNCAERTAIFKAVSEGAKRISMIAIVGGTNIDNQAKVNQMAYPCGACRQVMREFCNPDELVIIVAKSVEEYKTYKLSELLLDSFGPDFKDGI